MKKVFSNIILVSFALLIVSCGNASSTSSSQNETASSQTQQSSSEIKPSSSKPSSNTAGSASFVRDQLSTSSGLTIKFNAKGARVESIRWNGKQIAKDGFIVGRCANRIANAKFTLNGKEYNLTKFSDGSSLHGGGQGGNWQGPFANASWTKVSQDEFSISYSLHSKDGDNGYPGNMDMTVKYTLSEDGELSIEYQAKSDADTLCNPTNHLFFAINGNNSYSNIKLWIDADNYTPLKNGIPDGTVVQVKNTQFDYSEEKAFDGSKSYDDNYVLNGEGYRKVATMSGTSLGIKVDVYTDRLGLQLYKDGNGNICLESQQFPDMINQPTFAKYGTTVLKANEDFYSKTTYRFSKVN